MFKNLKIRGKLLGAILTPVVLVFVGLITFVTLSVTGTAEKNAYEKASTMAQDYGNQFEGELECALDAGRIIAQAFKGMKLSGFTDRDAYDAVLVQILKDNPDFLGTYTLWEPNALDGKDDEYANTPVSDKSGRFIPYWNRGTGSIIMEPLMEYENSGIGDYYQIPKRTKQEAILEPYLYKIGGKDVLLTSMVTPIVIHNRFVGIAGVDLTLTLLQDLISRVTPYDTGYGMLISSDANLVAHPEADLLGKSLDSAFADINNKSQILSDIKKGIRESRAFTRRFKDTKTNEEYLAAFAPVNIGQTTTPWSFSVIIPMNKVLAEAKAMRNILIILAAVSLLILVVIVYIVSSIASGFIVNLVTRATDIAQGDLQVDRLEVKSNDEIGLLSDAFNRMTHSLKGKLEIIQKIAEGAGDFTVEVELASEKDSFGKAIGKMLYSLNYILGEVNKAAWQIADGGNQVSSASGALASGATEQAGSLEQISTSATQISSQAKQNAENAEVARNLAEKARVTSEEGNQKMVELIKSMEKINSSSEDIKQVVKVIDDIAFQTNLLALNANVEAARAGKFGKGFSVVAEEVRNLATKSAQSVKQTTAMVEESIKNIQEGNKLVKSTADFLEDIMNGAIKAARLMGEIAVASNEQYQGLEQINTGLSQIEIVTQTNSASAEEGAAASETLAEQAQWLKNMVAKFKLKEHASTLELPYKKE